MRLTLTLQRSGTPTVDVVITVEPGSTIGDVATEILRSDPARAHARSVDLPFTIGLTESGDSRVLDRRLPISASGIHPGSTIELVPAGTQYTEEIDPTATVATLVVVDGPDIGRTFPLRVGVNQVGRSRDSDVYLSDPMVSKQHARINVTDTVEIIDLQSSNGLVVDGTRLDRVELRRDQTVVLGDTTIRVEHHGGMAALHPLVPFNRSPRLDPVYAGQKFVAPEPPRPPQRAHFPMIPLLVPILMGAVLYAITKQLVTIAFIALSPLMLVGMFVENRRAGKRAFLEDTALFRAALVALADDLAAAAEQERVARLGEHPAAADVVQAVERRSPLLWTRRPDERGFLELRLGLGASASRNMVEITSTNATTPELWRELQDVPARFALTAGVPIVAEFAVHGAVGLGGPRTRTAPCLRSLVAQLVGLHSPAELVLAAMASLDVAKEWEWFKWLPHVASDHSPIAAEHLAGAPGSIDQLTAALEEVVEHRHLAASGDRELVKLPACVLIVDNDAVFDRSRLNDIVEHGPAVGVHVVWVASELDDVPAACRAYLDLTNEGAVAGLITDQRAVEPVTTDRLDPDATVSTVRQLAALYDSGAPRADEAELPSVVPYLDLVGLDAGSSTEWVLEHWRANRSVPGITEEPTQRTARSDLAAVVGRSSPVDVLRLDLRSQGPHALVGGTTGAGKSEFLQTWITGLALAYSPARVTFLFVDYKGGAAFADCSQLPHTVGTFTDLNQHLVRRALTSLHAELRYREGVLQQKRAKDVLELERRGDPDTPPSLVIVVDEFAALVSELPEFVDGVVNVAQRGRSLGLHLILATQRPKGVIKENLRANTNLRVALRVADEEDSSDVVGSVLAAGFDPSIPGRGVAKAGPGRLTSFQTAYVGGWSAKGPIEPPIEIGELRFGATIPWEPPTLPAPPSSDELGLTDLQLVVANVRAAAEAAGIAEPRKPWLPELPDVLDLDQVRRALSDSELVFGRLDEPADQRQTSAAFFPDREGSMAVFGTGGSGKSTFLRTLTVVAGLTARGGPCHVYGIDCGAKGLQVLEDLPHVGSVISGDDEERIARLLRTLRTLIDDRATRFAAVDAGNLDTYRRAAARPAEPRILLLIDGFAQFRQNYETSRLLFFDHLQQIASDGRQVGVHLVLTADRGATVPSAIASAIQRRLVLRLASDHDYYGLAEVDAEALDTAPPGRGFLGGLEIQVAVLAGTNDVARQAAAVRALATELRRDHRASEAPPIERLVEHIDLAELPAAIDGLPAFGIADESLAPIGFLARGSFLVVGPHQSGCTTVTATLAAALRRITPDIQLALFTLARSPLIGALDWSEVHTDLDAIVDACDRLQSELKAGVTKIAVVIESFPDFAQSSADMALEALVKTARSVGVIVIAEGESASVIGAYGGFVTAIKADRQGVALQPEQTDGDVIFKTAFPRVSRSAFPPGRGLYVSAGRVSRVQCAEQRQ